MFELGNDHSNNIFHKKDVFTKRTQNSAIVAPLVRGVYNLSEQGRVKEKLDVVTPSPESVMTACPPLTCT